MSLSSDSQQLAIIRDEARILVQRAGDHEDGLEALVAASESYLRRAEAALSQSLDVTRGCVERLQALLGTQLQQTRAGTQIARQLCASAHRQRVAAALLLTHLHRDVSAEPRTDERVDPHSVLVVDDYGDLREVIATVLRNAGFVVRTAANGLEGLLTAYEMRPAVIVMDVTMPVLDGIEATRLIKATEATCRARVIAYTGSSLGEDSTVQDLFAAVVQKPAPPQAVLATVRHVANL
jgi:two-component system, cell cycle response regulator DivK